jgi:TonB-linked SusC/RagA family outer membrane protein
LEAEAVHLEGIVAVGYGTQRARDVTGSVASVRAEDIQTIATPNAIEAIKGRVAGVDIVSGGFRPGDGVRVRVRGTRSIGAGNDPLFVVDGIPIPGGLEDFNPSNIQSIEILKDASATAIYGSRGANGVVLITTNRGSITGTRITYDTYYGVQNTRNDIPMMTGPEFATLKREAYRTVGRYQCPEGTDMRVGCPGGDQALFLPSELAGIQSGTSTDWQDLIKQPGSQMEHNVNVSGGNEQTRFTVSGSFFDQQGITRGMSFERTQGAASIDHRVGRLTLGSSLNVSQGIRNHGPGDGIWGQALSHGPLGAPFFEDGTPNPQPIADGLLWNPVLTIDNVISEETRNRVFGSIWAELDLAPGITVRSNFGPDLLHRTWGNFAGSASGSHRNSGNATASLFRDHRRAYTLSNFLTVDREFGDHRFNSTFLYEVQTENRSENTTSVAQLPYEHQRWHNVGSAGQISNVWSNYYEWLLQSFMGRINYGFRDKYLLTLTGRSDGSSRLAEGNKYSFFPSVAVAWQLGDEDFMRNMGVFDELKLRVSYGVTGNTSIDPYQTQGGLQRTVYSFDGAGAFGYRPSQLANPALGWEKTGSLDVGADFAVLNSRVTGTVDYYVQNTFDLLLSRQLPITSGFGSVLENIGETRNTGIELALSTINLDNPRGLSWSTDISWTRNRNQIVSLFGGAEDDIGSGWFIGQPIDVYYNYKLDGIWQEHEREQAALNNQRPGDIKVVDLNGDGRITGEDRMIIGRHERHPSWYGSLNNRFRFGRFDLSALAVARWGYTLNSAFHSGNNTLFGRYNNIRTDYWTPENPSNADPRPNADQEFPLYNTSRLYKDGSHIRIRHVRLGYRVPETVINRIGGQSLQIYATAQEPHIFTNYDGFDPESNQAGGTGAGSPSYRTLLIGASVGF